MSYNTHIQWADDSWNFIHGCTRTSEGCLNCYIDRTPPFRMSHNRFDSPDIGGATDLRLYPERLTLPLHWTKPRRIFVNSLSDMFHNQVADALIARAFATMAATPRHTYLLLTKRHARMKSLLSSGGQRLLEAAPDQKTAQAINDAGWPLPNLHLGVSTENQRWADIRIAALLDTPAAVRWISAEPLLGPIDLGMGDPHAGHEYDDVNGYPHPYICLTCSTDDNEVEYFRRGPADCFTEPHAGLDWVVVGGESGPGARPVNVEWVRSIVRDCVSADLPVFVKQFGSVWARENHATDRKGGNPAEWSEDLRVRQYPKTTMAVGAASRGQIAAIPSGMGGAA